MVLSRTSKRRKDPFRKEDSDTQFRLRRSRVDTLEEVREGFGRTTRTERVSSPSPDEKQTKKLRK